MFFILLASLLTLTIILYIFKTRQKLSLQGEACKINSKSFFFASKLFSSTVRNKIYIFYAFARASDDLIDECESKKALNLNILMLEKIINEVDEGRNSNISRDNLMEIIATNRQAFKTNKLSKNKIIKKSYDVLELNNFVPILLDFRDLVCESEIPKWVLSLLLEGFTHDSETSQVEDEDCLLEYCVGVASSIGIVCCYIFKKFDIPTLECATSLGIGMQLTNIARDILTDCQLKRTYIPNTWFEKENLTPEAFMTLSLREKQKYLKLYALRLVEMADVYYEKGFEGIKLLPNNAKLPVLSALLIYREIGLQLRQSVKKGESYPTRAHTSTQTKVYLYLKAKWMLSVGHFASIQFLKSSTFSNESKRLLERATK